MASGRQRFEARCRKGSGRGCERVLSEDERWSSALTYEDCHRVQQENTFSRKQDVNRDQSRKKPETVNRQEYDKYRVNTVNQSECGKEITGPWRANQVALASIVKNSDVITVWWGPYYIGPGKFCCVSKIDVIIWGIN